MVSPLRGLPVDTPDDLAEAATRVECGVDVRVRRRDLENGRAFARVHRVVEVDVVEL